MHTPSEEEGLGSGLPPTDMASWETTKGQYIRTGIICQALLTFCAIFDTKKCYPSMLSIKNNHKNNIYLGHFYKEEADEMSEVLDKIDGWVYNARHKLGLGQIGGREKCEGVNVKGVA